MGATYRGTCSAPSGCGLHPFAVPFRCKPEPPWFRIRRARQGHQADHARRSVTWLYLAAPQFLGCTSLNLSHWRQPQYRPPNAAAAADSANRARRCLSWCSTQMPLAFTCSWCSLVTGNPLFARHGDWGSIEAAALVTQGGGFSFTVGEDGFKLRRVTHRFLRVEPSVEML